MAAKPIAAIMTRPASTAGYELELLVAAGTLTIRPGAFVIYLVRHYIAFSRYRPSLGREAELLSPDAGFVHQPALRHGENGDAVLVRCIE